jgi:hypothetical protein
VHERVFTEEKAHPSISPLPGDLAEQGHGMLKSSWNLEFHSIFQEKLAPVRKRLPHS